MKKNINYIISIFILLLFISFLFYYFINKKSEENIKRFVFETKLECGKFIQQIKEEVSKNNLSNEKLIEIFYSNKLNSCLYVSESYDKHLNLSTKNFKDVLTTKTIQFETFYYECDESSLFGCKEDDLSKEQKENNIKQNLKNKNFEELINNYR
ncbi:MAG: hypothetical protein PHQ18_01985 [Patescibacteria group bacterium]|nr:hypothetical protein [Patescibacteria group bacterium]